MRSLAQLGGQTGLLRGNGHLLFEPKRNNSLAGEESLTQGFGGEREHKVIRGSEKNLEWLELGKDQMGRSKKEAGSVESGLDSREVPELV